jgi:serine/threonine protein phosphatase PrpC
MSGIAPSTSPLIRTEAVGKTDVGRQRDHNEDNLLVREELSIFAVADGMGGNNAGEVASALATKSLENFFQATERGGLPAGPETEASLPEGARRLIAAVRKANTDVFEISNTVPAHKGMGSTVVAAHVTEATRQIHIAHVGDSRCYRFRGNVLEQLTRDHSLIGEALAWNPNLDKADLAKLPKNVISRALGLKKSVQVDVRTDLVEPGDIYLLCSDGLSGMVSDQEMRELLELTEDAEEACDLLIALANEAGGEDNITLLIVKIFAETNDERGPHIEASPMQLDELFSGLPMANGDSSVRAQIEANLDAALSRCPFCGKEPKSQEVFCGHCGSRIG